MYFLGLEMKLSNIIDNMTYSIRSDFISDFISNITNELQEQ